MPEDYSHIPIEELFGKIEDTARKMDANLKRRVELEGTVVVQALGRSKKGKDGVPMVTTSPSL
jgi:hypothetical protein